MFTTQEALPLREAKFVNGEVYRLECLSAGGACLISSTKRVELTWYEMSRLHIQINSTIYNLKEVILHDLCSDIADAKFEVVDPAPIFKLIPRNSLEPNTP